MRTVSGVERLEGVEEFEGFEGFAGSISACCLFVELSMQPGASFESTKAMDGFNTLGRKMTSDFSMISFSGPNLPPQFLLCVHAIL